MQIESFYPKNQRPFKNNIIREYLQYKILEVIFSSKYAGKMTLVGGTSLRIIFQHSRFSEDLDFDIIGMEQNEFIEMSNLVNKRMKLEGYNTEIKSAFQGAYRTQIAFKDILFKQGLSGHKSEKLMIQVDAEAQGVAYKREKPLINRFDVFLRINSAPADILLSQKIYAILKRNRPMGRDFYDAIFLFGRTKPAFNYLKAKTGIPDMENLKQRLLSRCKDLNFNLLASDIKPYLFSPDEEKKILLFPDYIRTLNG